MNLQTQCTCTCTGRPTFAISRPFCVSFNSVNIKLVYSYSYILSLIIYYRTLCIELTLKNPLLSYSFRTMYYKMAHKSRIPVRDSEVTFSCWSTDTGQSTKAGTSTVRTHMQFPFTVCLTYVTITRDFTTDEYQKYHFIFINRSKTTT